MPDSWTEILLGELCDLVKGTSPTQKTPPGEYPLIVTAAQPLSSDSHQIDGEAVCVPMVSSTGHGHASLKRVHYASGKFAVANIIVACIVKDKELCDTRYLWLYLQARKDEVLVPRMQGTANVSLSQRELAKVPVVLPPLAEQRRIVDLIGALDETIEAAEQSSNASSALRLELLSSEFATAAASPIAEFAELLVGYAFKSSDYAAGGIRLLRGDNIVPGGMRWDDAKLIAEEDASAHSERYSLRADDIVLAMDRPVISSGVKAGLIKQEDLPALLVQRVARLRPSLKEHGRSIELCFGSREFRTYLESGQVGSHVPHINGKQIAEFRVPVSIFQPGGPELIGAANDAYVASSEYADSLSALRTSVLAVLLSGEHEIPSSYGEYLGVVA
ncbi:restriction endonuclease subunit S [Cryobacterium sp. TMT4-10]|uniref:restriction endonuclease subunit S n=1 Tax=Cryobacterium sp. TMT4-10 TaxID=1259256 RepID=UPI00106DB86E|nr:restriction endonuclease subunit S [Cryobacterium sp. TMT4-10]TFD17863.1 restriction endonuclease subunit S [Cryobacterium sp. TMT4-10]